MTLLSHRANVGPRGPRGAEVSRAVHVELSTDGWRPLPGTPFEVLLKGKGFMVLTVERRWRGEFADRLDGWEIPVDRVFIRYRYVSLRNRRREYRQRHRRPA